MNKWTINELSVYLWYSFFVCVFTMHESLTSVYENTSVARNCIYTYTPPTQANYPVTPIWKKKIARGKKHRIWQYDHYRCHFLRMNAFLKITLKPEVAVATSAEQWPECWRYTQVTSPYKRSEVFSCHGVVHVFFSFSLGVLCGANSTLHFLKLMIYVLARKLWIVASICYFK